ncbi:MAG TPA: hypothetical protein VLY24_03975 [Bryobacteraceae bacterium]|nr:hypothetical protein [Bryobacteraceae bacterium]
MAESRKLLGDVVIPGIEKVAIHRIMMGLRLYPFDITEQSWFQTALQASYPGRVEDKLVWWRLKQPDGSFTYVNVDPGEYRKAAPEGNVIIMDMPEMPDAQECRDILKDVIHRAEQSLITDRFYLDLTSAGKGLLERPEELARQALSRVEAIIPMMRSAEQEKVAGPLGDLYYHCHSCLEIDQATFAEIVLLLQLQRMTNAWIQERWVDEPGPFLNTFLGQLSSAAETKDRLQSACSQIAFVEYDRARLALKEGLEAGSLASMSRKLADAQLGFWMVNILQLKAANCGLSFKAPRPPVVLEESSACTVTGVGYFANVLTERPESIPLHLRDKASEEGIDEFQAARRWGATVTVPVVNRTFANILGAQAMTLAPEPEQVRAGLNRLLDGRSAGSDDSDAYFVDDDFERGWIDQALLSAYKKLGMEKEAYQMATRIVGRLMVSKLLADTKSTDKTDTKK